MQVRNCKIRLLSKAVLFACYPFHVLINSTISFKDEILGEALHVPPYTHALRRCVLEISQREEKNVSIMISRLREKNSLVGLREHFLSYLDEPYVTERLALYRPTPAPA
jgi:hypothetical protein